MRSFPARQTANRELKYEDECSYQATTGTDYGLEMVIYEDAPIRGRDGRYNAKLSGVPVAYSAQVSFTDCSVDHTRQLVLTVFVRYLNCVDGKLRSDVQSHG